MIRKISVIMLVLLVPLMAAGSFAASPSTATSPVQAYQFPGININISPNTSYNLSYMYLIVKSGNTLLSSSFDQDNWSITDHNNNSVTYTATLSLTTGGQNKPITSFFLNSGQTAGLSATQSNNTYSASVDIKVSKMGNTPGSLYLDNLSSTISSVGNSTISVLISIHFSQEIPGSGDVYLIQSIQGISNKAYPVKYSSFNADFNSTGTQQVQGLIVNTHSYTTSLNHDALYWWDSNYTQDGIAKTLNSTYFSDGSQEYVVFQYSFSNGVKSITQDPFISVPGVNIFDNPITEGQIGAAINYLLIHSEYLGAGLSGGLLLLGFSYGVYRRRKFL